MIDTGLFRRSQLAMIRRGWPRGCVTPAVRRSVERGDRMEAARIFNTGLGDGSGWEKTPDKLRSSIGGAVSTMWPGQPAVLA